MKLQGDSPSFQKQTNESNVQQSFENQNLANRTTQTTNNNQFKYIANQSIFQKKSNQPQNLPKTGNVNNISPNINSRSNQDNFQTPLGQTPSNQPNQNDQSQFRPKIHLNNASRIIHPANYFEISKNGYESTSQNEGAQIFQSRKRNPNDYSEIRDNEIFRTPYQDQRFYQRMDQSSNINNFEEQSTIKQSLSGLKQTTAIRGSQNFNKTKAECKSLRLIGNISQVNPIHAYDHKDKSFYQQKNSFPKHDNLKNTFGLNKSILQNRNIEISPTFYNPEKNNFQDEFYQSDQNIAQIIDSCSFEQKQKALKVSSDLVEKIAGKQANMLINNISNQYGGQNQFNKERIQDLEFCEFEPIQFQAYSQNLIPEEIQKIILKQKIEILDGKNLSYKSIVERINIFQNIGSMVDGYYYTIDQTENENCLYLWKVDQKNLNIQKGEWLNLKPDQNLNINKIRFEYPIQSVCYVENHSENFKPMLIIATSQEIQLRTFVPRPENQNFMLSTSKFKIERQSYDLLYLENNKFEPIVLDLGEEISKIVQMKKTGKIFYSSHKNSYNQVFIKELKLPQSQQQKKKNIKHQKLDFSISNLIQSSRIGQSVKLIGQSFIPQIKRIQSVKAQDRSNIFVNALKQIVPNFLNFTIQKKCILDIQIDEQRNILYSLTNKIKQKSVQSRDNQYQDRSQDSSNWLYSSGELEIFSESVIEVYDLGILCKDFSKVCEIDQDRLFNIAQESWGQYFKKSDRKKYQRVFDQFRIVSVHPITISQSDDRQLLITVVNGTRFFISFQQKPQQDTPYEKEVEQNELMFDQLQLLRFNQQWNVVSINFLPSLDEAISQYNQNPNPFRLLQLQKQNQLNLSKQSDWNSYFNETLPFFDEYLLKPRPAYCNQLSCFVYSEIKQPQLQSNLQELDEDEESRKFLNISILSKNEPTFCYSRKINQEDFQALNIQVNETYSIVQIQSLEKINDKQFINNIPDQNIGEKEEESFPDEFIIQISTPSNHGFLTGPIDKEININTQRMMGANQALKLNQGWGVNNGLQYMPINEMEKQVYEAFDLQTIKVLTNQRLISLVVMRPIDQLLGILELIQTQQNGAYDLDQFNDFIMKYSIEEVCCMLIQIISEQSQSKYLSSLKFDKEIQEHQRNHKYMKLNADHYQGKSFSKQPRQMGNLSKSKIGSKISFQASHQSKVSPFTTSGLKFVKSQRGASPFREQNPQNLLMSQINEREQNDLSQLSFVYLNQLQENNKYQINSEIDKNCIYKNLTNQRLRLISIASELLQIYGDSTKKFSHDNIIETYKSKGFLKQIYINQDLITTTISSLFTYIQRILRPIWDLNITMTKKSTNIMEQESNTQMFYPALQKLQNILILLQRQNLFKQQTIEDQARILAQDVKIIDRKDIGINHKGVLSEIEFVFNFDSITKENMDIHKNKILRNIIIFVKRCIDVIEFLKIVTFQTNNEDDQNSNDQFDKMLKQIGQQSEGKNLLKEIQLTQYKDLVRYGGCNEFVFQDKKLMNSIYGQLNLQKIDTDKFKVVKVLYENCLQIQIEIERQPEQNPNFDYHKIYNFKAEMIQRMCPTLFSVNQTQTFIGECILQHSLQEQDIKKQDQIIYQGIRQLKIAPLEINLDTVVPTLIKIGRMIEITDLVMEKIKWLNESMERKRNESINSSMYMESQKKSENILPIDSQYEQLFECFELIVGQYRALDDHIFEINKQQNLKKQDKFIRSILDLKSQERIYNEMKKHKTQEMKWYDMFYKYFNESSFKSYSNQIKFQLRSEIIKCVQQYEEKYLLKFLFEYIVYQPTNNLKYQNLPKLDFASFKEVYEHITSERQISKESIEILINHLCRYQNFEDQVINNEKSELYIKEELSKMLCKFVLRLFIDKDLKITSTPQEGKTIQQSYLTCENKIKYCQLAIDSINSVEQESNQQIAAQYLQQMQSFLETFFFEKKVIQAVQSKYDRITEYQKRLDQNQDVYMQLTENRNELFKLKNTLETLNYKQSELFQEIVVKYLLFELIYEYLYQRMKFLKDQIQYEQEDHEIQHIEHEIIDFFRMNVEEIVYSSNVRSEQQVSKKIKPYTWIEVFKEIFKVQNHLSKFFNNHPEIYTNSSMIILQTYLSEKIKNQYCKDSLQDESDFSILTNSINQLMETEQFANNQECYIVGQIIDTLQQRPYSKIFASNIYKELQKFYAKQVLSDEEAASIEFNRKIFQMLAFIFFWTKKNYIELQKSQISKSQIQVRGNLQENNFIRDLKVYITPTKDQVSILEKDLEEINNIVINENVKLMLPKEYQQVVDSLIKQILSNIKILKD